MPTTAQQIIADECAGVSRSMGLLNPDENDNLAGDVWEYVADHGADGNDIRRMWEWVMLHVMPGTSEDYCATLFACIATAYAECGTCHGTGVDPDGGECGPETWATACPCWLGELLDDGERATLARLSAAGRNAAHRGVDAATRPVAMGTVKMRRAW